MARRTPKEAKVTRLTIFEAAAKLFETKGYFDTTIDEISKTASVTKGALFHHFSSKEVLFTEIWTQLQVKMDTEARDAAEAARSHKDPYAAFLAGVRVYMKWAARPGFQRIVIIDGPNVLGQVGWYESDSDLGIENVRAGLAYLVKRGIIAEGSETELAILLQSALNGAGHALARHHSGVSGNSLYEAFEMLLRNAR